MTQKAPLTRLHHRAGDGLRTAMPALALASVIAAATSLANAQQVGTAAAVNPASTARDTAGITRTIVMGQSIAHRERIQTTSAGSVQLLFLDKTSMTIGPNSDVAIDEYVYDPRASTGRIAATLAKGAMRFVGGQISHSGDAEIKTANAVVGIRGGVVLFNGPNVYVGYGSASVSSSGETVTLGAGQYTQTSGGGTPPTPPGPPPAGFVQAQVQTFQSTGGQTGGAAPSAATPARVAQAEANATGSSSGTVANVAQVTNGTVQLAQQNQSSQGTTTSFTSSIVQSAQTSTQAQATNQIAAQIVEQQQLHQLQFGAAPFALTSTNCCATTNQTSPVPFLPANYATGSGYVAPMLGYRTASVDSPNRLAVMQFGIGINGVGSAQSSWFFVQQGGFISDGNGGIALSSGFGASRMGAANLGAGFAGGAISSAPGATAVGPDLLPTTAAVQNLYLEPENLQYLANTPTYNLGDGTPPSSYNINQTLTSTTVPTGLGTNRPAVTLSGFVGGLARTFDNTSGTYLGPTQAMFGTAAITLDPNLNRVQANFFVGYTSGGSNDSLSTGSYQFGSLVLPRAKAAYIDYNNFGGRSAMTVPDLSTGVEIPVSQISTTGISTMQTPLGQNAFFVTMTPAAQQQIAPALSTAPINFCQCDYTRWGFWSNADSRTGSNGHALVDVGHLMTWVAGQLPNISDVPATGIATYDGMVVASVKNGANQYVSGGNLTNSVNFGSRTMSLTVTNLDNTNYSGVGTISSSDPRNFNASLTGAGRGMIMTGQFYRGTASPVSEMGGNVFMSGTNYLGSGIFAARAR